MLRNRKGGESNGAVLQKETIGEGECREDMGVREKRERKTTEETQYENTMVKTNALAE